MKILLLNPNTSQGVTDKIVEAAKLAISPGTEIISLTAPRGVPYIATRSESVIGAAVALEMLADHHGDVDAAVIAAFGDPGLGGARELFPIPIVGLAEAGMLTACMLGRRFGIVTFAEALGPWYEECVAWNRLEERCAGVRTLTASFQSIDHVSSEKEDVLVELAMRSVEIDQADVILLAGAPLAGLAQRVRERIPVPVIDCVGAAVRQAETLVALQPKKALSGTYRRPAPKSSIGLPTKLSDWIAHEVNE